MDDFAEAVVDRIEPILDTEFHTLPEHEQPSAIDAVRDRRTGRHLAVAKPVGADDQDTGIRATPALTTPWN